MGEDTPMDSKVSSTGAKKSCEEEDDDDDDTAAAEKKRGSFILLAVCILCLDGDMQKAPGKLG
jgi:hypothetical protein